MYLNFLIKIVKRLLKNDLVLSYVFTYLLDKLHILSKRSSTNIDDEMVAKIRQDLLTLGYIKEWVYLVNNASLHLWLHS